jgi:putative FmdB family regulatory protein
MPFYEYECPNCGFRDEVLQKINDKPLKKCPSCGKNGLKKLMSAPVFRLKGSGWYETDFKGDKDNKRNLAGPDKDEAKVEAKVEAKTEAKADSKADTKAETKPETPKPVEKASKSASKPAAKRAKPKAKASRPAKRR